MYKFKNKMPLTFRLKILIVLIVWEILARIEIFFLFFGIDLSQPFPYTPEQTYKEYKEECRLADKIEHEYKIAQEKKARSNKQ